MFFSYSNGLLQHTHVWDERKLGRVNRVGPKLRLSFFSTFYSLQSLACYDDLIKHTGHKPQNDYFTRPVARCPQTISVT